VTPYCERGPALSRRLFLLTLALFVLASCSGRSTGGGESPAESPQAPAVENSGRHLSGVYSLKVEQDDYSASESLEAATLTFEESGNLKRDRRGAKGAVVSEEGSYVLGTRGELVLFIEKIGGELLEAARPERYTVVEETASRMKLQVGPGGSFILEKKE
jgi:hypothetical protein